MSADSSTDDDRLHVCCIYCNQPQSVSRRALIITCIHCNKRITIESLTIERYQARRSIETCGSLTVERDGNVFSDRIVCGSLVVRGKVRGKIVCLGPVLIGPEAQVRGDLTAPSLAVGAGAILQGRYQIGPKPRHGYALASYCGETSQPPPSAL